MELQQLIRQCTLGSYEWKDFNIEMSSAEAPSVTHGEGLVSMVRRPQVRRRYQKLRKECGKVR